MCQQCKKYLPDYENGSYDRKMLDNSDSYYMMDTTILSYIIIAANCQSGSKQREVQLEFLEDFLKWYEKNRKDEYEMGFDNMKSKDTLSCIIHMTKNWADLKHIEAVWKGGKNYAMFNYTMATLALGIAIGYYVLA